MMRRQVVYDSLLQTVRWDGHIDVLLEHLTVSAEHRFWILVERRVLETGFGWKMGYCKNTLTLLNLGIGLHLAALILARLLVPLICVMACWLCWEELRGFSGVSSY